MVKIRIRDKFFIYVIIYKIILDLSYIPVSKLYSYRQLYISFNYPRYILSWIVTLFLGIFISPDNGKVSNKIMQLHYCIMIIPFLSICGLKNQSVIFALMLCICFFLEILLINSNWNIKIIKFKNGKLFLWPFLILLTLYTYVSLFKRNSINLSVLSMGEIIYNIRAEIDYGSTLLRYTSIWQFRVINPYFIVYGAAKNNVKLSIVFVILQFIMYLIIPRKEVFFSIAYIICFIIILERYNFKNFIFISFSLLIVITTGLYYLTKWTLGIALFPTRLLFDSAVIKYEYYDVFSKILPKLFYSESRIGRLFGKAYPYDRAIGYIVNHYFIPNIDSEANTGYLAYGYANAGFIGMIIISFLFVLLLKLIDSETHSQKYAFVFCAYAFTSLNDGDLLMAILTGGLMLVVFIFLLDQDIFGQVSSSKYICNTILEDK